MDGSQEQVVSPLCGDDDPPEDAHQDTAGQHGQDADADQAELAEALAAAEKTDLIVFDVDDDDIGEEDEAGQRSDAPAEYYVGLQKRLEPFAKLLVPVDPHNQIQIQARLDAIQSFRAANASDLAETLAVRYSDLGPLFCRICQDTGDAAAAEEQLVSPCLCRGSVASVHLSCLERWLAESDSSRCELCGHQYRTIRTPSYNVFASIPIWMIQTGSTDLLFDFAAFVIFTPMAMFGTHLGMNAEDSIFFQVSLMAAIDLVFSAWLTMRLHYHALCWYSWWRRKSTVRVILENEDINVKETGN